MSLKTQLTLFVLGLLIVVLGTTFWINLNSTRMFLQQQLHTHAQDTATSLGVTLSHAVSPDDLASMETYINAIFDRGYYLEISLTDPEGKPLYRKTNPLKIEGIPTWFIQLIDLHPATASSEIIAGWVPVGSIHVTSHPGYAYVQLWETFINAMITFMLIALLAIGSAMLYLSRLLQPLKQMVQQARAIVNKHYVIQDQLPHTRELKEVVHAINSMVTKLKDIFTREAEINARLQKMAYEDPVTHLGNRAYFEMVLDSLLSDETEAHRGSITILRLTHLQQLNETLGYPGVNALIKEWVQQLQTQLQLFPNTLMARLNGSEFALLIPDQTPHTLEQYLRRLPEAFQTLQQAHHINPPQSTLIIGLSDYLPGEKRAQVLMRANKALQQAQHSQTHFHLTIIHAAASSEQLSATIRTALTQKRIQLNVQPVRHWPDKTPYNLEVFAQLLDEQDNPIPAKTFLPILAAQGWEAEFDRLTMEQVLQALAEHPSLPQLSVNLTRTPLEDSTQQAWLIARLQQSAQVERLVFELSESFLHHSPSACTQLSKTLRDLGCGIALDHFGRQLGDKQFLQQLKPVYIKLAFGFGEALKQQDEKTAVYLASLIEMAQNQDIAPIATGIEDEALITAYQAIGIQLFQGYTLGAPIPLDQWIKQHATH